MNTPVTELHPTDTEAKKEYAVKDIYMAAYLLALGHKLDYARSDGYQAEFFFKNVPSSDFLCYYNGDVHPKLSARNLFDAFQNARRVSRQIRVVPSVIDEE
jgi:hypothetical protein